MYPCRALEIVGLSLLTCRLSLVRRELNCRACNPGWTELSVALPFLGHRLDQHHLSCFLVGRSFPPATRPTYSHSPPAKVWDHLRFTARLHHMGVLFSGDPPSWFSTKKGSPQTTSRPGPRCGVVGGGQKAELDVFRVGLWSICPPGKRSTRETVPWPRTSISR